MFRTCVCDRQRFSELAWATGERSQNLCDAEQKCETCVGRSTRVATTCVGHQKGCGHLYGTSQPAIRTNLFLVRWLRSAQSSPAPDFHKLLSRCHEPTLTTPPSRRHASKVDLRHVPPDASVRPQVPQLKSTAQLNKSERTVISDAKVPPVKAGDADDLNALAPPMAPLARG